ncbi:MAG: DNA cytosine methyltransferase [Bacteroidia bacterium]
MNNGFKIVVSDVQAYKQFGNSVSISVVSTLAKEIKRQLL